MVRVIAHRGFSGKYPENTACAFRAALELNVHMVEFDVRLTKDEQLVIMHDATVDRTTNGSGQVAEMTLSQLEVLDAGGWFDSRFAKERIPTLREALDLLEGKVRLNIHLKAFASAREVLVSRVVAELAEMDLVDHCFIASDEETIELAKRMQPAIAICNLSTSPFGTYIDRSMAIGCSILQPSNRQVTPEFVATAHQEGMEVNPFYADDAEEMLRLIECGVDGILTNHPDLLMQIQR